MNYVARASVTSKRHGKNFSNEIIRPMAQELDETENFPHDLYLNMGELGLFGIGVPEEDGGPGFDTLLMH